MSDDFAKKKKHGSRFWKATLAVFVIVGIMGLLAVRDGGTQFGGLDLPGFDLGEIASGLTTLINPSSGSGFQFSLTTDSNMFSGSSIELNDVVVIVDGVHASDVSLGQTTYQTSGKTVKVELDGFSGRIEFDNFGLMLVGGKAKGAIISDGPSIKPVKDTFTVTVSVFPKSYFVAPIVKNRIVLSGIYGTLERTTGEASTHTLRNATIKITNFVGNVRLDKSHVLNGFASQIRGPTFVLK